MAQPAGEAESDALRLDFDRRLRLEFHGSSVTSDAGLLAYRELDDSLGLMAFAGQRQVDSRMGRKSRHELVGMLRQLVFGRLAGYEDVNDAERLGRDPAMRLRPARLGVSRLSGCRATRTSSRSPVFPDNGSTAFMAGARSGPSFSIWIRVSAQPMAIRKAPNRSRPATASAICAASSAPMLPSPTPRSTSPGSRRLQEVNDSLACS